MQYLLFVAQSPPVSPSERDWKRVYGHNWVYFLHGDEQSPGAIQRAPEGSRLGEGTWLIPLESVPQTLASLVPWCHQCKVSFRITVFDKRPEFTGGDNLTSEHPGANGS